MLIPLNASAHAAEQGFVLLLPTTLYTIGGTLAVAFSVAFVCLLSPQRTTKLFEPIVLGNAPDLKNAPLLTSLLASIVFAALIFVGMAGPTDPQENLLPLTIWTIWWIGLVAFQGIVGDIWRWINPWRGLYDLAIGTQMPPLKLPKSAGVWPAVILLVAFNVFAIADIAPSDPRRLAGFALAYWVFTFGGMIAFGSGPWLRQVECFSVFFGMLSRLAPLQFDGKIRIGVPGWHYFAGNQIGTSAAIFCIALLAMGSFDGLHETFWWLAKIGVNPLEFPGRSAVFWPSTLGLLGACVLLAGVFAIAVWIGLKLARLDGFIRAFSGFALTVLPIALGYHIAHFLVTFLLQIQYVHIALANPLGRGVALFDLGDFQVTTGFLVVPSTVEVIWLTQAGVVVVSHILAVLMAHRVAHDIFASNRQVVLGQLGVAALMIAYTVFGLWLLASPRGA